MNFSNKSTSVSAHPSIAQIPASITPVTISSYLSGAIILTLLFAMLATSLSTAQLLPKVVKQGTRSIIKVLLTLSSIYLKAKINQVLTTNSLN